MREKDGEKNGPAGGTGVPRWKGKRYAFFAHRECEYFPCHAGADPERFNCLFCYCPLYLLGGRCGGNFTYRKNGVKDCTRCLFPHDPDNYGRIVGRYRDILAALPGPGKERDGKEPR